MSYYEVTIYCVETAHPYIFKIDEQEILSFIDLIANRITNLESFYIYKHTYDPTAISGGDHD